MVIHRQRRYMKTRKGQILILTLIVMAMGMIIISPMLGYLDSSYRQFTYEIIQTKAYYTTDAVMETIISDIYRGVNIYEQNISTPYGQGTVFLDSGYTIEVGINRSIPFPLPTPQGSSDWFYFDPGITICNSSSCDSSKLLKSLAYGSTHNYSVYLVGGNSVQINWAMDDSHDWCWLGSGSYHVGGTLSIYYWNGTKAAGPSGGINTSQMCRIWLNWSVPEGSTGNYTIAFKNNNCYRQTVSNVITCSFTNTTRPSYSAAFLGADDTDYTWVRVGTEINGEVYSYNDYYVTATAKRGNEPIVSIVAAIRHNPGPQGYWMEQTVEIPSWQITYY
jgi:hypothetical protein